MNDAKIHYKIKTLFFIEFRRRKFSERAANGVQAAEPDDAIEAENKPSFAT